MTAFQQSVPPDPKRLYRNRQEGVLWGVCAGIADYVGWDRTLVRLGFVLGMFAAGPFTLCSYVVLRIVMPVRPDGLFVDEREQSFWQSVNTRPAGTVGDLARKFGDLDRRLAQMERKVTSPDYSLNREFRNLGA
jgi:phage shock protein C